MKRLLAWEKYIPAAVALIAGIVYLSTMAPGITHTDSGELAAVASTGGIAHPTGYPLWTMLGWVFTLIPGIRDAWLLNFMCLLFVSGGVYLFGRSMALVFGEFRTKIKGEKADLVSRVDLARIFAVLTGLLFFAFGRTVWAQAVELEVYSLHILLLNLNLFLLLKAWYAPVEKDRPWLLFALAFALAFANHLTIVVLIPAVAWMYFAKNKFNKQSIIRLAKMLGVFFPLLILIYAYLPLRAAADPQYNWGNPVGWDEIYHQVSGQQFQVWWWQGSEAFAEQFKAFFSRLGNEWSYAVPILLLSMVGIWYSLKVRMKLGVFFIIAFVTNVLYSANYNIKDPEPYYLLALTTIAIWAAFGMRWIWIKMKTTRQVRFALSGVVMLLVVVALAMNYSPVNQRNTHQFEDFSRAALQSLPPNSMVISQQWDALISPSYYLQGVEDLRSDVQIFEYAIMRNRHWYPNFMRRNFPEISKRLGNRLTEWEKAVQDFDLHGKVDPERLGETFKALCFGLFEETQNRHVFISPEMPSQDLPVPPGKALVPHQYFFEVIPMQIMNEYQEVAVPNDEIRLPAYSDELNETEALRRTLAQIWSARAEYEAKFGKQDRALLWKAKVDGLGFPAGRK
jgi:hypothetical protein